MINQIKIINEKSPRIYNNSGNIINSRIFINKNWYRDITKNIIEQNYK